MLTSFRTMIIANPGSAGGSLGRRWTALSSLIRGNFGQFDHCFTTGPGDATRLTRQALTAGFEMVVAMGGDGTISEVVDGFFDHDHPISPEAVLGVLHFGTGGDFCRSIGAPKRIRSGARALAGRRTRNVDVGRMVFVDEHGQQRTRYFINVASFGISGIVDQLVNRSSKALGGRLSFAMATVRAMRRYRPQAARIKLDDGDFQQIALHNVAVANGQYFGGGMRIAPAAKLDDGLLDLVVIGPMSMSDLLRKGPRIYRGSHIELPQVTMATARRIDAVPLDPTDHILLDVDGETPGMLPASFEVLPGAIRLKQPEL